MMLISFAWTTPPFLAGHKTCTRRQWSIEYASRFKLGDVCKAYDRQPRFGGKPIGFLKIISLDLEDVKTMPNSDFEAEGFSYMQEKGLTIWGKEPQQAFDDWRNDGGMYWVLRFKKVVE